MIFQQVSAGNDILASEHNNLRSDMPQEGMVILHGGGSAPTGWFLCDGSGKDTTTYADLFAIIGYTFGGAGATFNLPDLRDSFAVGHLAVTRPIGTTGGGSVTITESAMYAHTHSITTDPDHIHTAPQSGGGGSSTQVIRRIGSKADSITNTHATSTDGAHDHGAATGNAGSGTAVTILPEYLAINYIIKF